MDQVDLELVRSVSSRHEIAELLARYCRGIDRCDADELDRVFADDATLDYGSGPRDKASTCASLLAALSGMRLTHHRICNTIIELYGDRAKAETGCVALHILGEHGAEVEMTVGGRYLDRLERRDGSWRITERLYVMDWNRQGPTTMQVEGGLYDSLRRRGARKPDDPLYEWKAR